MVEVLYNSDLTLFLLQGKKLAQVMNYIDRCKLDKIKIIQAIAQLISYRRYRKYPYIKVLNMIDNLAALLNSLSINENKNISDVSFRFDFFETLADQHYTASKLCSINAYLLLLKYEPNIAKTDLQKYRFSVYKRYLDAAMKFKYLENEAFQRTLIMNYYTNKAATDKLFMFGLNIYASKYYIKKSYGRISPQSHIYYTRSYVGNSYGNIVPAHKLRWVRKKYNGDVNAPTPEEFFINYAITHNRLALLKKKIFPYHRSKDFRSSLYYSGL